MANDERDNRLDQIKEGAGLEDSRINKDFVDFVRKWSTPVLLVAALISLGYFGYNKRVEAKAARIDEAFQQYNLSAETVSPSPDALRRIAQDYKRVEGVYLLATTKAADEYLRAVQRGVKPGSTLTEAGEIENETDLLTPEDLEKFLDEAEALYKEVHSASVEKPAFALHTLNALYGLAAVAESRGDSTAAKNVLEQAAALAEHHGYLEQNALAKMRIAAAASLGEPVSLPRKADLPPIPALAPKPPVLPPVEDAAGPQLPGYPPADGEAAPPTEDEAPPAEGDTPPTEGGAGPTGDGGGSADADGGR